jgi:pimeloyl-ACP methyl ester carboxylesterase
MPAVLVHGVPETQHVWDALTAALGRNDVKTPSLPGFGNSRPGGFGATKEEYIEWLVAELEAVREPVDLVGHDWGGGFTVRLVSVRPDLVRSWITDAAGVGDVGFEWHDFAKIWQTPDAGEQFWAEQLQAPPKERAVVFETFGVPATAALDLATRVDQEMVDCILALYRSATAVGAEWGPEFADVPKPGLVMLPGDDPFLGTKSATAAATRAGARTAQLDGVGHWWMLQDPERAAGLLERFWASLD